MPKRVLPELPPTTAAYLAGLVDGEGTISIHRLGYGRKVPAEEYGVSLSVAQKDPAILLWIKELIGGGAIVTKNPSARSWGRASGSVCYSLQLQYHQAYQLIRQIRPYLRIKSRHAQIAMDCHEAKLLWDAERRHFPVKLRVKQPEELLERCRAWSAEIQSLNYGAVARAGKPNLGYANQARIEHVTSGGVF